jgi:hypothetical protein
MHSMRAVERRGQVLGLSEGTCKNQGYKTPPNQVDLQRVDRTICFNGTLGLVLFNVVAGVGYLSLPAFIDFPVDLAERLAFAARANAVVLFCVLVAVGLVASTRRVSPEEWPPGAGHSRWAESGKPDRTEWRLGVHVRKRADHQNR